mmetsp:Transcript_45619/g.87249  ORF Transcript_45619/g.87249 Transcript_45619/m.87249 type:complete len:305 (+) Transcript_45619:729-1643(+)
MHPLRLGSRVRTCTCGLLPASTASTLSSTRCATQYSRSRISSSTGKVGGALRSITDLVVPRSLASSSPSVTVCTPPTRSDSVGFLMRFSRSCPCAVPTSCTPRSAMVRQASASASVPISSTMITSGMWFSTASIITRCCSDGSATCMRRAPPIAGWGTSPSPPISLEVSTMTTRLFSSSESTRASSRITVVLPTPGRPRKRMESLPSNKSRIISTCPVTERPTRHVRPTMFPRRLRMQLMRCKVPGIPALLSPPNSPMDPVASASSSSEISSSRRNCTADAPRKRASGLRPRSNTTSNSSARSG